MDLSKARSPNARDTIIEAATELIRVHGVVGMSISELIATSGTSAGAIYHHFGSKEGLVLEIGRNAVSAPMAMLLRTTPGLSPVDLFEAALAQVAQDERTPELLLQVWAGAKSDPLLSTLVQQEAAAMRAAVRSVMAAWCAEHSPDTDPDNLVDVTLGLVMGYAVQRALALIGDPDAYRELGARLLTAALETGATHVT